MKMAELLVELRPLFVRYLLLAIGLFAAYSLLNGWLVIRAQRELFNDFVLNFVIPVVIAALLAFIGLRPLLRRLSAKFEVVHPNEVNASLIRTAGRAMEIGHCAVAAMAIALPTALFQSYLNEPTGRRLLWVLGSFFVGGLFWFGSLLVSLLSAQDIQRRIHNESSASAEQAGQTAAVPPRDYALHVLIGLNVIVFVAMAASGRGVWMFDANDLLRWGANHGPSLGGFGTLRLISSQFVHVGILHLIGNLYFLGFVGGALRPVLPRFKLMLAYLATGLGGSLAGAWIHPELVSAGASGSIFGLFGVFLILLVLRDPRLKESRVTELINAVLILSFNLILGAIGLGIDNAAHVGGLITGVAIGLLLHVGRGSKSVAQ